MRFLAVLLSSSLLLHGVPAQSLSATPQSFHGVLSPFTSQAVVPWLKLSDRNGGDRIAAREIHTITSQTVLTVTSIHPEVGMANIEDPKSPPLWRSLRAPVREALIHLLAESHVWRRVEILNERTVFFNSKDYIQFFIILFWLSYRSGIPELVEYTFLSNEKHVLPLRRAIIRELENDDKRYVERALLEVFSHISITSLNQFAKSHLVRQHEFASIQFVGRVADLNAKIRELQPELELQKVLAYQRAAALYTELQHMYQDHPGKYSTMYARVYRLMALLATKSLQVIQRHARPGRREIEIRAEIQAILRWHKSIVGASSEYVAATTGVIELCELYTRYLALSLGEPGLFYHQEAKRLRLQVNQFRRLRLQELRKALEEDPTYPADLYLGGVNSVQPEKQREPIHPVSQHARDVINSPALIVWNPIEDTILGLYLHQIALVAFVAGVIIFFGSLRHHLTIGWVIPLILILIGQLLHRSASWLYAGGSQLYALRIVTALNTPSQWKINGETDELSAEDVSSYLLRVVTDQGVYRTVLVHGVRLAFEVLMHRRGKQGFWVKIIAQMKSVLWNYQRRGLSSGEFRQQVISLIRRTMLDDIETNPPKYLRPMIPQGPPSYFYPQALLRAA